MTESNVEVSGSEEQQPQSEAVSVERVKKVHIVRNSLVPCDAGDYTIKQHFAHFMTNSPFFCELSRHVRKFPTKSLPTIGVAYDMRNDEVCMAYNPDFMKTLTNWETNGVLRHEFYHLVFGHLNARRKTPPQMWNVAADLAINSIILDTPGTNCNSEQKEGDRPLPKCGLFPGEWPAKPDGREMSAEEKQGSKIGKLIADMPRNKASEWYYMKLQEFANENPDQAGQLTGGDGIIVIGPMDSHEAWDDVPEEQREFIREKIKAMVEKAVKRADAASNGWGDIPQELREQIRLSVSNVVNWRAVLRQFMGSIVRGSRRTSIMRINRRYPFIHPGVKRGYTAKLLLARDESGSVYDEMLAEFTAELWAVTRKVEVDFLPFDCSADESDIVRCAKGTLPDKAFTRTRGGGTDFNAPTRIFNDPKNRGRWDGLLILTDGMAPKPDACRGKRGWVLAKGCKLEFPTDELVITMEKDKALEGAWR